MAFFFGLAWLCSFSHLCVTSPQGAALAKPWHPPWQKSDSKKGTYVCDVRPSGDGWCWATEDSVVSRRWGQAETSLISLRGGGGAAPVQACSPVPLKADWHLAH